MRKLAALSILAALLVGCTETVGAPPTVSPGRIAPSATVQPVLSTIPLIPSTTSQPSETPVTTVKKQFVAQSRPVEIYWPSLNVRRQIAEEVCPVAGQPPMIDPDRSKLMEACYLVGSKYVYELPGSEARDVVVLAGHTSRKRDTAFNPLYDWRNGRFTIALGQEMWVRTVASGDQWLVYRAVSTYTPGKYGGLMNDKEIWGSAPTPGVALTIGCAQPSDLSAHSSENIVIKWQFSGVR